MNLKRLGNIPEGCNRMGAPITIFYLIRFDGCDSSCRHHLLLSVEQPEFANWSESSYNEAVTEVLRKRDGIIRMHRDGRLKQCCSYQHQHVIEGELQNPPVGDELFAEHGQFDLDIWVAETECGHPWVVLGVATSEDEFWRHVADDEDLSSIRPRRPARQTRVFFAVDSDYPLI